MRVISGKARSIRLKTIEGMDTRPTTDRIKETLFNMINNRMCDCRFLDLFCGSGGIGIEALSRGAKEAVFVDSSRKCQQCVKDNLKATHLEKNSKILCLPAVAAIKKIDGSGTFDVIFMDPPYNNEYEKEILKELKHTSLVDEDTLIIVEASIETDFSYLTELGYEIVKEKIYKTNKHEFIQLI